MASSFQPDEPNQLTHKESEVKGEDNNEGDNVINGLTDNPDRGVIGAASDNIWNLGVGAVKGISWTLSSTYNYSVGLLNRSYSLKMKDKNE